jgi:hypothetical protein
VDQLFNKAYRACVLQAKVWIVGYVCLLISEVVMRDLKFRAWRGELGMYTWDVISAFNCDEYYQCLESSHPLMQYTGLKDKNGVEIYEGDIVKYHLFRHNYRTGVVESTELGGYGPFEYNGGGEVDPESCIVIGNIYESPEFLDT